jgi:hypothetical protein
VDSTSGNIALKRIPASHIALLLLVMACFTCLVAYGASGGPRGSDQYWYIADSESLASGKGPLTNNIFPAAINNENPSLKQPFIHNILSVYMAVPATRILGGHWGWIVTNLVSTLIAVILIYMTVFRLAGPLAGLASSLTFIMMPLTFWQASQPLAEASMFMLSASFMAVLSLAHGRFRKYVLLLLPAGALFLCRKSFILFLVSVPVLFMLNSREKIKVRCVKASILIAISGLIIASGRALFPEGVHWDFSQILMSAIPRETSNIEIFFLLEPIEFSFSKWLYKSFLMLKTQVAGNRGAFGGTNTKALLLFYLPYNAMAIAFLYSIRKSLFKSEWAQAGIVFILVHLASITVFQNYFRYMAPVLPVLVAATGIAVFRAGADRFRSGVFAVIILIALSGGALDLSMAKYTRSDGIAKASQKQKFDDAISSLVPASQNVIVGRANSWDFIMLGYILRPRLVLILDEKSYQPYTTEQYVHFARVVDARWLICRKDSILPEALGQYISQPKDLPYGYVAYALDIST